MVNTLHMLNKSNAEPLHQVLPDSQSGKFIGITIVLEHRIVLTTSVRFLSGLFSCLTSSNGKRA